MPRPDYDRRVRPLEVFALNEQMFRATGSIPYRSLRWVRRYTEPGEFEMVVPADVYDPSWAYIYTDFRPETGIIQKVQYDDDATSYAGIDSVTVSGFFLESVLNNVTFLDEQPDIHEEEHVINIPKPSNPYYKMYHVPTLYQDPVGEYYVSDGNGGIVSVDDGRTIDSAEGLDVVYDGHDFPAGSVSASYNYFSEPGSDKVHVIDPYDRGTASDGAEYDVVVKVPETGTVFYRDRFNQVKPALGCVEREGDTYAAKKRTYDALNGKTWTETVTLQGPWQLTDVMEPVTAGDSVEIVMRWVRRMMGDWLNYAVTDVAGVHKTVDPSFQRLGDLAYSTLYEVGASLRVEYNFLNDGFLLSVYRGKDRTQEGNLAEEAALAAAPRLAALSAGEPYPVPAGYTALEYVESHATTAADGQHVDTGYKVTQQTSVEVDFQFTDTTNHTWMGLLGSRGAGPGYESRACFICMDGKWRFDWVDTHSETTMLSDALARHQLVMSGGTASLEDGTSITIPRTMSSNPYDLYLFSLNTGGSQSTCCNARIYSAKIAEGGVPQMNLVPARRDSDGAVGLYDTVGGSFHPGEGTGSLVAGPDVPRTATLTYLANAADATGAMEVASGVVGGTVTVALCQYSRTGYSFVEWDTEPDGGGTAYLPGSDYVLTGSDVLYAVWQADEQPGPGPDPEPSVGGNPWCVFSDTWGTISGYRASRDVSNYRNACYVLYDYEEPESFDDEGQPEIKVEYHTNTDGLTIVEFYTDGAKVWVPSKKVQGVAKARIDDGEPEAQTYLDIRSEKPSCDGYWSREVKELSFAKGTEDEEIESQVAEAKEGLVDTYEDGTKVDMAEIYEAFRGSLVQRGLDELAENYGVVTSLDAGAVDTYGYLREWDLGDLVDFGVSTVGLMETGRVIEVEEVYEGGARPSIKMTVGDKELTATKRASLH